MAQSTVSTWLQFALQQMAAESYLDRTADLEEILTDGNNDRRVIPLDQFTGKTQFTDLQAEAFVQRYQILDHHANDATGFSATLMRDITTGEYTLSFRSTESRPSAEGGDRERDFFGADLEIGTSGFAFGQLTAMEEYYQQLKNSGLLPTGAVLNVIGYSLSGHLATVFTELHGLETNPSFSFGHTYIFNGPGHGTFNIALSDEAAEAQRMREMNLERIAA